MTTIPRASVSARNIAHYASAWGVAQYTREEGLWPIERQLVNEFMPAPPARMLDLGCGAGRTTIGLARLGYDVTAIDLSEPLLRHARSRHPALDFRLMDATALSFPDASFNAALFSYNGLDDIAPTSARERCLSEVHRILRPQGVFVLSGHNAIGHFFSGGYFYLRGYINAVKMIARQRSNPLLRHWYFRYDSPGGQQVLFSAPPSRTIAQLQHVGFDVVDVRGATGERRPSRVRMRQAHVYFVARKPAA